LPGNRFSHKRENSIIDKKNKRKEVRFHVFGGTWSFRGQTKGRGRESSAVEAEKKENQLRRQTTKDWGCGGVRVFGGGGRKPVQKMTEEFSYETGESKCAGLRQVEGTSVVGIKCSEAPTTN